ncbi:MAG: stage 0 sporulation family protein [Thermodesulfovibrionales bacterium]|nr:stage 0 sporulation family protein [Nitrospinota bacterium]MCG2709806.1 stage 0 sporulation family protein [Thermodesulfovibrionales bacterium]MDP3048092.1 stage 0 sporulation family protein [Thermodesulfovibrionales bacterium]
MPDVIGIRFKDCGKIYDFEANGSGAEFKKGDCVVVESDLGLSIGSVIIGRRTVETSSRELKKVLRKATEDDFKQKQDNEAFEKEAKDYCIERIMARGLPMKLVFTESTLDKKRIVFYFTADGRIDFRELVKDLAAKFKTRIEMRQIGVRDEAKIVGGFGMCGRELCCRTFLTSFEPISIKMAKQQELVLNMSKLSGICGRLMCCLSYEIPDETTGIQPKDEIMAMGKSKPFQDETEDVPQLEVIETVSRYTETPVPALQSAAPASSDKPQTETAKENATGQKQETGQEHRKRKRWRWRKFHKK